MYENITIQKKNEVITFIQIVCSYAVITLHTNGCFWVFSNTERYWKTANVIESVFYFAVPVFFMITGITLIDYPDRYTDLRYFLRRIERTMLPYIAWSFIGILYLYATGMITGKQRMFTLEYVINGLLNGSIIGIYYFFPALFCVYLMIPLFAAVGKNKRKYVFRYLTILGFISNILIPFIINVSGVDIKWPYHISGISGYLIYVAAGVLLYRYMNGAAVKWIIIAFGIFGLLLHIIGTYRLSMIGGGVFRKSIKGTIICHVFYIHQGFLSYLWKLAGK